MERSGRPNMIEDYIVSLRGGDFIHWKDSKNKIYANLEITDGGYKPTEQECNDGLKVMQDVWDLENNSYKSKRKKEFPSIVDQLDDLYHNGIDGWKATIKTTKDKYPKESR